MNVDTWAGLETMINLVLIDALNEVGEYVAGKMKFYIDKDIYSYDPTTYDRTGEFLESVVSDPAKIVRPGEIRVNVHHDVSKMSTDAENFTHGSMYWSPNDIRSYLPEILAFNKSGDIFGENKSWHNRSNYWEDTLKALTATGELRQVLRTALRKRGLTVK